MTFFFTEIDPLVRASVFCALGIVVGNLICRAIIRLTEHDDTDVPNAKGSTRINSAHWHRLPLAGCLLSGGKGRYRGQKTGGWWLLVELATGGLFAGFAHAYLELHCQQVFPEVRPSEIWFQARFVYHLILITLLITATGTDFRDYTISDWITIPGMMIGVVGASLGGELQMIHIWVDWNDPLAELHGPYLPEWMKHHQHLHGLAWSLSGLVAGAVSTWLVRGLSKLMLGQDAMGFGDVTLMAMIGSFIGWQPVLFVFLLAPLCGLVVSMTVRMLSGRGFLPYGPYLSAAALLVLFGWRWIWTLEIPISADRKFSVRLLMGDWQGLLYLFGISFGAFLILLGMLRLYRAVPIGERADQDILNDFDPAEPADETGSHPAQASDETSQDQQKK